jgi:zinc finger protein
VTCPICGSQAIRRVKYVRTFLGLVEVISIRCDVCGYKHTTEALIEPVELGPEEIVIRINSEQDLKTFIFKSRFAEVSFLELGVTIYPGPEASDEIYPIEGLLEKYIERIEASCPGSEDPEKCLEIVSILKEAKEGRRNITILIRDPSKFSRILSSENIGTR